MWGDNLKKNCYSTTNNDKKKCVLIVFFSRENRPPNPAAEKCFFLANFPVAILVLFRLAKSEVKRQILTDTLCEKGYPATTEENLLRKTLKCFTHPFFYKKKGKQIWHKNHFRDERRSNLGPQYGFMHITRPFSVFNAGQFFCVQNQAIFLSTRQCKFFRPRNQAFHPTHIHTTSKNHMICFGNSFQEKRKFLNFENHQLFWIQENGGPKIK